mgnify:CR=1 FL=1
MGAHFDCKQAALVGVRKLRECLPGITDCCLRKYVSILVCHTDMVLLISEVDADYRSVLFGFHRRIRSQTAGAASTPSHPISCVAGDGEEGRKEP